MSNWGEQIADAVYVIVQSFVVGMILGVFYYLIMYVLWR